MSTNKYLSNKRSSDLEFTQMHELTNSINQMRTSITRIESAVHTIKDDLLPPVAKDAKAAREGTIQLDARLTAVENKNYVCTEDDRIHEMAVAIGKGQEQQKNTAHTLWWIIGVAGSIFGTVSCAAIAFALLTRSTTTENTTKLLAAEKTIVRHEKTIDILQRTQKLDRKLYLDEIKSLPVKVHEVTCQRLLTRDEIGSAIRGLQLSNSDRSTMLQILDQAKKQAGP